MAKRLRVSILCILTALVCFALVFGLALWNNATTAKASNVSDDGTTVTFSDDDYTRYYSSITGLTETAKADWTESITKVVFDFPSDATSVQSGFYDAIKDKINENISVELNLPSGMTSSVSSIYYHAMNVTKVTVAAKNNYLATNATGTYLKTTGYQSTSRMLLWSLGEIPTDVTGIDSNAMHGVESVHIPANITYIAKGAGSNDPYNAFDKSLKNITVAANNTVFSDGGKNCLINKTNTTLLLSVSGEIPTDASLVTKLYNGSMYGFSEVTIPANISNISVGAFDSALTKITVVPENTYYKSTEDGNCLLDLHYGSVSLLMTLDGTIPMDAGITDLNMALVKGQDITIPASVEFIYGTFDSAIQHIDVEEGNTVYSVNTEKTALIEKDPFGGDSVNLKWTKTGIVPDGVTTIERNIMHGIADVTIPASVNDIDVNAFNSELQTITVANDNDTYSDGGNHDCLLEKATGKLIKLAASATTGGKITLSSEIKIVGANTFAGLGLTEITIPNTVEKIESAALSGCKGLQKLTLPFVGVSKTETAASKNTEFGEIFKYEAYNTPDGYIRIFRKYGSDSDIPATLTEVYITGSGLTLFPYAFSDEVSTFKPVSNEFAKTNIEKIELPADVRFGGNGENVFETGAKFVTTGDDGFVYWGNADNPKLIMATGDKEALTVRIPDGVSIICADVFKNAEVVEIELPASLNQICDNAFDGCARLCEVYNLSKLDIEQGATTHGKVALNAVVHNNEPLTESKIKVVGDYTFIANDVPELFSYNGTEKTLTLLPDYNGKRYIINSLAFANNTDITDVVIPANSALNIGDSAFENCTNLKSVVINDLENSIGEAAFKGCTSLTSVTFYNCHITEISDQAFMNCSSLLEIAVPNSVTSIGKQAFSDCTSAVAITLGKNVEFIGGSAFEGTTSLRTASIPDSVTRLGNNSSNTGNPDGWNWDYLFRNSGIESVYIGSGVKYLGGTFTDCVNLRQVNFAKDSSLLNISYAFQYCTALTTLTIPEGVTNAIWSLNGVTNLTSLYIPYSLVNVMDWGNNLSMYSEVCLRQGQYDNETSMWRGYAHLTMYLPDLPKDATADEIDAFARKLAVFAVYSDESCVWTYISSKENHEKNDKPETAWLDRSTVFGNQITVLSKAAYDAVYKVLSDTSDGNLYSKFTISGRSFEKGYNGVVFDGLNTREDILSHFYYEADVTYQLYKTMSDGNTNFIDSETVQKLAQNEGADIRYVLKTDKYGSKYYEIDESFAMPSMIGATNTGATWKIDTVNGDELELDGAKISGATTYVNVLGKDEPLILNVSEEYTDDYTGEEWILPEELAGKVGITAVNGNSSVTSIEGAGTYEVTLTANSDYAFADGGKTATVTVVINKAQAQVVWTYKGEVLNEGEIVSKTFDGKAVADELKLTYIDVNKVTQTISNDLISRMLNGESTMAKAMGAGLWTLNLSELVLNAQIPNYAFTHTSHQFRIDNAKLSAQQTIDGMDIDLEGNANLSSSILYIYQKGGNIVPSYVQLGEGYTLVEVVNVQASIARYIKSAHTLAATVKTDDLDKISVVTDENTATFTDVGKYTTVIAVTAKDNYEFVLTGNVANAAALGLGISVSDNGKTMTIRKTWYIVQLDNEILMENATSEDEVFTISGWVFGAENVVIPLPRLMHGDEDVPDTDWRTNTNVTITLTKQGVSKPIVSGGSRANLAVYINNAMPAGTYTLRIDVKDFSLGAHTNWWNGASTDEASYPAFYREYTFTVTPAQVDLGITPGANGYANYRWELNSDDKAGFFETFETLINENISLTEVKLGASSPYLDYSYGNHSITYNFARMNSAVYYPTNNTDLVNLISGGATGTYTVYFSVKADNHATVGGAGTSDRYDYFFTVTVYEKIDVTSIVVEDVEYTGGRAVPVIATDTRYGIVWDTDDEYVNGGEHRVTFVLTDSVHYEWLGTGVSEDGTTVSVLFEITPANNDKWSSDPSVIAWEFGGFVAESNLFIAVPKYLDEGELVHFAIAYDADGNKLVEGLENFTAPGGIVAEAFRKALNTLPSTDNDAPYYIIVTVGETANHLGNTAVIPLVVAKGTNTWAVTPNVMQWRFGGYDVKVNLVLAEAKIEDAENPVVFKVTSDKDGKTVLVKEFTLKNGLVPDSVAAAFAEFKVGNYYLWASVAATDSYSALSPAPFEFAVTKAVNYWNEAFNIVTWVEGKYEAETNVLTANAHFGSVTVKIVDANDEEVVFYEGANATEDFTAALAGLKAGRYVLTATVADAADFGALNDFIVFSVFEKPGLPWWATLLIVVGALGIVALVLFILHQKGVLQMLTGKFVIAMRTKATVDATIAAVRANKVAERAKQTVAEAEAKDAAEARKKAIEEAKARPIEEQAADLDEKAVQAAAKAERIQKRAEEMQKRAAKMKEQAANTDNTSGENVTPDDEQ